MHLTYKSDDSDLPGNFPNEECAQPIQEVVINGPKPKNESIAASPASGWSGPSFLSDMASYFTGGGRNSGGGGGAVSC